MEALIIFAIVVLIFTFIAVVDYLFSVVMYCIYLYDGGKRSFKWYKEFMKDAIIEW